MKSNIQATDKAILEKIFLDGKGPVSESLPAGIDWIAAKAPHVLPDTFIHLSKSRQDILGFEKHHYHYISNPDGSMRWIWPAGLKNPTFLNFYSPAGLKARVITETIKTAFKLGLEHWISSGSFTAYSRANIPLEQNILLNQRENYSVFTGTVGPNRKAVVEINQNGKTLRFVKIPLTTNSASLIHHEMDSLYEVRKMNLAFMKVPASAFFRENGVAVLENIMPGKNVRTSEFSTVHTAALTELYRKSNQVGNLAASALLTDISTNLRQATRAAKIPGSENLIRNLHTLMNSLDRNQPIVTAMAHMDFTPWNMFSDIDRLYVYDWELARKDMPLLFDYFHFEFQNGILQRHEGFEAIYSRIKKDASDGNISGIIQSYNINLDLHLALYLLYTASYYLELYSRQEKLHMQVNWLLKAWNDGLEYLVGTNRTISDRTVFIHQLMEYLQGKKYAWLKGMGESIFQIAESSDIDLLISRKLNRGIMDMIQHSDLVNKAVPFKKSYMNTVEIFFHDGTWLSLDLIWKFRRKSTAYLDPLDMLEHATKDQYGISVPSVYHDLEYICLFYHLNHGKVPERYYHYFLDLPTAKRLGFKFYFNNKYHVQGNPFEKGPEALFFPVREKVVKSILGSEENRGLVGTWNKLMYLFDSIKEFIGRTGFTITFSGVDGAGKTTIINEVKERLQGNYRKKVVVLRHRPSLLPILSAYKYGKTEAEERAANSLPRLGQNNGSISSILRFAYYYTDYLFGQFYFSIRYLHRGYIVIYDRYYFDFINDGRRSNLNINKGIALQLYTLVMKPRLNFFLYAPSEEILNRKNELKKEDIEELTESYVNLFAAFSKKYHRSSYLSISNIDKNTTVKHIFDHIQKAV